ncbi:monocarboxylate transporter 12-like [Glandiceps talaboti]
MSQKRTKEIADVSEPPDGGYGWVVAISGMMVMILNGGAFYASGIFLVEFIQYFKLGAENVGWIGAISGFIYISIGPLSATLTKKLGTRVVLMIGSLLNLIGFVLSTFASSLSLLYFTYGVLLGFGSGLPLAAVVIHINKYFRERFVFANGLCFSGYAIGLLISSPLFYFLIEIFGWRGALLVIGGINANTMVCAALMRPLKTTHVDRNKEDESIVPHTTVVSQMAKNLVNRKGETSCTISNLHAMHSSTTTITDSDKVKGNQNEQHTLSFLGSNLFVKYPAFSLICFAQILEGIGCSTVTYHLVNRAITSGISKFDSAMLMTYFACTGLFARLTHGFIIYYKLISPTRLLGIAIGILGLGIVLNPVTDNYAVLATLAGMQGLSVGTYQPLISVSMEELVGSQDMGIAFGWDYFCMGLGYLIGPSFSGWLFDVTGNYKLTFYITGVLTIISGIVAVVAPDVNRWNKKICTRKSHHSEEEIFEAPPILSNHQGVENGSFVDNCASSIV